MEIETEIITTQKIILSQAHKQQNMNFEPSRHEPLLKVEPLKARPNEISAANIIFKPLGAAGKTKGGKPPLHSQTQIAFVSAALEFAIENYRYNKGG